MASNPPGNCCTVGVKHEGTPTGEMIKIGNNNHQIDAYLATPPADCKTPHRDTAILYIPDVWGIWPNSQLLADQYAANGYLTLIPDVFNGDPMTAEKKAAPGFDLMGWVQHGTGGDNPHLTPQVDPIVAEGIRYLREERGVRNLGAVGYCFGAKYLARHYGEKEGIQCGYMAHPSFVEEGELLGFKGPLSIAAAETDEIFPAAKRHRTEELLAQRGGGGGDASAPWQICLYSGVVHGFTVRCDVRNKVEKFSKEQGFLQAVRWFDNWLV